MPSVALSPRGWVQLQDRHESFIVSGMSVAAVFWDRDDTLIRDSGYIRDPEQVELLPGAAAALRAISDAGFENIIITNQSGIARGYFDEPTLEKIHDRLVGRLAEQGARIDAIYFCPFLAGEEAVVERYRQDSDLRKPKPGMILQASLERKIDLAGSWMIGDSLHDAQAGRAAGCRTILVRKPGQTETPRKGGDVDFVADSPEEAARIVIKYTRTTESKRPTASAPAVEKPAASADTESGTSIAVLQEILTFLRTVDRRSRAEHFSLAQMTGTLVQMMVLGVGVWSVFGWLRGDATDLSIRLLFAILLQLIALTCFVAGPRRW